MPPTIAPEIHDRDLESNEATSNSRQFGLFSCYEARLNATILQRAMDRERARRPLTTKCGRLARTEAPAHDAGEIVHQKTASIQRPRFVQVIARSALATEPA